MNFDLAIQFVLLHEGDYVNHPSDPGGETKYGISKRAFPNEDIPRLTVERAKEIYRQYYWDKCRCDELPPWARLIVLDCAVNQGVARSVIFIQRTVGTNTDGIIGPKTLSALMNQDAFEFIESYSKHRLNAYMSHPQWNVFSKGWAKRLFEVTVLSLKRLQIGPGH